MKFCPFCGNSLNEGAKFCSECGASLVKKENNDPVNGETGVRNKSIKGEYPNHICPGCGAALNSFSAVCPCCGREVMRAGSHGACRELSLKLEEIERNKPAVSKAANVTSMVSAVASGLMGTSFKDPAAKEQSRIDANINKLKFEAISNFVVPNNKADIMEFLFMAESNCNSYKLGKSYDGHIGEYDADAFVELWQEKFDEVFRKALIVLSDDPDFLKLKRRKEAEEAARKQKEFEEAEALRIKEENKLSKKLGRKIYNAIDSKLN